MDQTTRWRRLRMKSFLAIIGIIIAIMIQSADGSERAVAESDRNHEKRDIWKEIACAIGFKDCSDGHTNYPPSIKCPDKLTFTAEIGHNTAQVDWKPPVATDKEDGTLGATQIQATVMNSGQYYPEGTYEITYRAQDSSGALATCSFRIQVVVHRCSADFSRLLHGNYSCSIDNQGENPVWGTECVYGCEMGYELSGVDKAICDLSGDWLDTSGNGVSAPPACNAIKCGQIPSVTHGRITCSDSTYGTRCPVTCDPGYKVDGSDQITCQYDKQWSNPGRCKDDEPPKINFQCGKYIDAFAGPNLSPVYVNWTLPTATDNSGVTPTVTSNPMPGYFPPNITKVTITATDSSNNIATCSMFVNVTVRRCPLASAPNNADMLCTHNNAYGSECNTTCHTGYELSGNGVQTCEDNLSWSGQPPSCHPKQCGAPPPVQNGRIDCNSTTYHSMCTLTCGQGYQVFGNDSITCQNDKLWTHPGKCKDVEPPRFQCGQDIHTTAGPKLAPAIVTWTMPIATDNSGLTPNMTSDPRPGSLFAPGVTTVNFTATDDDNNVARCSIIVNVTVNTCPPAPTPNNANISCTHGNAYGSVCVTTCNPGYELKGDRTQTCDANLIWSGQSRCERMSCQDPIFDLSSNHMMIYDCKNGHYLGESCTIRCQDGNPPGGSQVINCTRDASAPPGHDMQWNYIGNAAPYCHAGVCTKLVAPKDGSLACDYINGTGEVCVPSCSANVMRPPTMPDVYKCLDRTVLWDPNDYVPDCFGRRRPGLPVIVPDFYYYSNVCDPNSDEIKQNFLKALNQSFVCSGGCNDISTITVTCYANNAGKRDAATSSAYLVVISPEISLGAMVDQGDTTDTKKYYDQLSMQMNTDLQTESDNGLFNVPKIGVYDGYGAGLAQYRCEAGMVLDLKSLYCAGCGEGHYYDSTTTTCIACPVGTYQDQEVAFQCTQCPDNKTTKTTRARSVQECQNFCHPGTSSQSGFEPCDPCPRGSYQSEFSKTSCDYCPYGMSTLASGSKTKSDCQFFDIVMTNETTGPWIQMFDKTPQTFSIVTWVHVTSGSQRTTLTFAMDQTQARSDSAYLALGDTKIYVSAREDYISRIIRKWYHLALIYDHGEVQLYIDREIMITIKNVSFSDLWKKTFSFVSSKGLQSVVLSHLEMTRSVLTLDDITPMFVSCDLTVDQNILVTNKVDDTLVTPSTCDDINDCSSDPCGEHGTCLDGRAGYTCLCEVGWGGTTCREPLSGE